MKTLTYLLSIIMLICFGSCKQTTEKKAESGDQQNSESVSAQDNDDTKAVKKMSCDEFLDAYEKYMEEYIELTGEYMKNPSDPALREKYSKLAQKATEWAQQWTSVYSCTNEAKYQKRFEEISERLEKKLQDINM